MASRYSSSPVLVLVLVLVLGTLAAGCATVQPHEREHLADPVMQFEGRSRESALENHVLSNREGSFGGHGAGGGGCGCN